MGTHGCTLGLERSYPAERCYRHAQHEKMQVERENVLSGNVDRSASRRSHALHAVWSAGLEAENLVSNIRQPPHN